MNHLERESDAYDHQGAEYPLIVFDEATHFCVTPDHEVLTEEGWKPIAAVKIGERVATLGWDREILYAPVKDTPSSHFKGELVSLYQQSGISIRATPNHRVLVNRRDEDGSLGFVRADRLLTTSQIVPRTGSYRGEPPPTDVTFAVPVGRGHGENTNATERIGLDDWLEFLGWFLSEGSAFEKSSSPVVSIRQTKPAPSLDALMARLPWRSSPDGDGGYRIYSRQLFEIVREMGHDTYTRRAPRWLMKLPAEKIQIFLDAFALGDGSALGAGAWTCTLACEGLIDDLQELCTLAGSVTTKASVINNKGFRAWRLGVSKRGRVATQTRGAETESYDGPVHCLTVAYTGNFLVRHRGRCHFTGNSSSQFWYLFSRNRAPIEARVRPYIRMTCNPDPDSWVMTEFLDPAGYIDEEGFPRPEMAGRLMWFARDVGEQESLVWGRSPAEVAEKAPHLFEKLPPEMLCRSFTFVPAKLSDNPSMGDDYLAQLSALPLVERRRLRDGNWRARDTAGTVFRGAWFEVIDERPDKKCRRVRYWDLAGSKRRRSDFTAGVRMAKREDKVCVIEDVQSGKMRPGETEDLIKRVAQDDGRDVEIWIEEEKGASSKFVVHHFAKELQGFTVRGSSVSEGDKLTRMKPMSSAAEHGLIKLLEGKWNEPFKAQAQAVPDGKNDDEIDAACGAFNRLQEGAFAWVTVKR